MIALLKRLTPIQVKRVLKRLLQPPKPVVPFDPTHDIYAILVNELGHTRTERVQRRLASHGYKIVRH